MTFPHHALYRLFRPFQVGTVGLTIAAAALITALPAKSEQSSNFGDFQLNPKTRGAAVDGRTGGGTSLAAVTTNYDRDDNQCFGFGSPKPDHILDLKQKADRLRIVVDSRGQDTTLVIQAPDKSFLCADDFENDKDAGIEAEALKPGKYKLWIGSVTPNQRRKYRLKIQAF